MTICTLAKVIKYNNILILFYLKAAMVLKTNTRCTLNLKKNRTVALCVNSFFILCNITHYMSTISLKCLNWKHSNLNGMYKRNFFGKWQKWYRVKITTNENYDSRVKANYIYEIFGAHDNSFLIYYSEVFFSCHHSHYWFLDSMAWAVDWLESNQHLTSFDDLLLSWFFFA